MTMRAGDVEFRQTRVLVGWGGLGKERRGEEMMFWCLRGICFYGEIIFLRNNKFYFLF